MIFWPCCCSACFKPCDCFARNCELHITSAGWTDNAATDCAGIADRVFNKTHVITSVNVTSGPEYGVTCDFTISYEDLILTKLPGGGCICKAQPALYTIEGTLFCTRGEDGTYGLSMVLHFKVPVYDEDEGCSPSPCVLEPKWETWTANYVLVSGGLTSSPICNFGTDGLGPFTFNTDATAQTTCGYGLDGTDATVTLEWKFCDPAPSNTCCGSDPCCDWGPEFWPNTITLTVSGVADGIPNTGSFADNYNCSLCETIDGTYVLERESGTCFYLLDMTDFDICDTGEAADPIGYLTFSPCQNDLCQRQASITLGGSYGAGLSPTQTALFWGVLGCIPTPDGEVLSFEYYQNWLANYCDFTGATVTIGFP